MTTEHREEKKQLRRRMRQIIEKLPAEQRHEQSMQICRRLIQLDAFRTGSTVMLYLPLASEVDVTPLALRCFRSSRNVCVPRVDWQRKDMSAVEVDSFDDDVMDLDEHGVRTPRHYRIVVPTQIDLVVVPGLAFDAAGRRLGRGAGYYDRFLGRLRRHAVRIGVAFDIQIVDEVPADDMDKRMDLVVTERRCCGLTGSRTGS